MGDVLLTTLISVFKVLACVYDAVTFLPYYLCYAPGKVLARSQRIKAKRVSDDPSSPYRSLEIPASGLSMSLFPECDTLDDLFSRACGLYKEQQCLGTREMLREEDEVQPNGRVFKKLVLGEYQWQSYQQVAERITNFGEGMMTLGLKSRSRIVIFAETRAEWMIAAQTAFRCNFTVVTLYATLGVDALTHGINETDVTHVITSADLLPKFATVLPKTKSVTHLVVMANEGQKVKLEHDTEVKVITMAEVERMGAASQQNLMSGIVKPTRSDVAVIMYTSGSTGLPKGVIISHNNLMCGTSGQVERIYQLGEADTYVGYLPLAHVLELCAEISCVAKGTKIGYSSPLTLTDTSSKIMKGTKGDVTVLRPTLIAAVPVIMDRIYKGVWDKVNSGSVLKQAMFKFAYDYKKSRLENGFDTPLCNKLVFDKIRKLLGGRVRMMLCGGAPLSGATQRFMNICFCCPVGQGYGLTETSGAGTVTEYTDLSVDRVGAPLICCEIRLRNWPEGNYMNTDKPFPRGEILIGGGNVAVGYFKNEEKTREDFTDIDGIHYFCSGDIGQFEADGSLRIIDRKKDLVKLQHGEYVSLARVETVVKMCPLVDQVCVHAESLHNNTVALVVPNEAHLKTLAQEIGASGQSELDRHASHTALCANPKVVAEVAKRIMAHSIKSKLEKFEIPTKVTLYPEPWLPDTGLVTDAFKLKRKVISDRFRDDIDRMYN